MSIFTSSRERRLWLLAFAVVAAIFSTLVLPRPLQEMLRDQNVQAVFFLGGLILTATAVIAHGIKIKSGKSEIVTWIGLASVYIMLVFRLGALERSHLIEYTVLAIFIHRALIERDLSENRILRQGLIAFFLTSLLGCIDECLQLLLPNRVFDPVDILFNTLAALIAIGGSMAIQLVRRK